jgi:NADPH:quinone reductase-like Zn-dependent oxidoreductase
MTENISEIKMPTDIPTTMAAVLLTGHGGIEMLEYREDVAVPVPGPDEVLIRVGAAGVNNTDINTRTDRLVLEVRDRRDRERRGRGLRPDR